MDTRDAWLDDVRRWYFDEDRVDFEQQLPPANDDAPLIQAPRPSPLNERPMA